MVMKMPVFWYGESGIVVNFDIFLLSPEKNVNGDLNDEVVKFVVIYPPMLVQRVT